MTLKSWTWPAVLAALYITLYILPLGVRPMIIPDETRYAEIPREMIENGDFLSLRLNGLRYYEKPAMGYWLNALSMKLFGQNAFAVRFPSALSAGLSALAVFLLVAWFGRGRVFGLAAAALYLTLIQVYAIGVFSVLDSMLSLFVTACLAAFFAAWSQEAGSRRRLFWLVISGVFCGLAFLTKGFLAAVLPVIVIIPFLFWEKKLRSLPGIVGVMFGVAFCVVLPWAIGVHLKEPGFWDFFFWNEHIRRFMADNAQHRQPFYFFAVLLPLCLLPWTMLVPAALAGLRARPLPESFFRYCLCWALFPFLFFSVCSGKLLTYILPCFPPLAILISAGLAEGLTGGRSKMADLGTWLMAGFIGLLLIVLAVAQSGMVQGFVAFQDTWKTALFALCLIVFGILVMISTKVGRPLARMAIFAAAPLLFYGCAHFLMPDLTVERKAPGVFFEANQDLVTDQTLIVSQGSLIRAVCWHFKRDDVFQMGEGGELAYGLSWPDAAHRLLTPERFTDLVKSRALDRGGKADVLLVMDLTKERLWKDRIPAPLARIPNGKTGCILAVY